LKVPEDESMHSLVPKVVLSSLLIGGLTACGLAPLIAATPPELGDTKTAAPDSMTMVYVPAGEFLMGSEKGTDERPVHAVYLEGYWIDQTEISNAMYTKCMQAGGCSPPASRTYLDDPQYANHPVVFVSWVNARDYCSWAGRRLPTEAEWEKAASWDPATNLPRLYPWGNEYDCSKGNYDDEVELDASLMTETDIGCDGHVRSAPVGSYPQGASVYGALDMGGNAWEWVNDAFLEVDPINPSVKNYYEVSPYENPQGVDPSLTEYRVVRGGSWNLTFGYGRSAYRLWFGLDDAYDGIGFRCALSKNP
jgi:formylglycine-generating enzyme required for sulfatase activity